MRFSDREEDDVQISLLPLIDVVFLLLIFFMVSTTFSKESELRIQLPESSDTPQSEQRPQNLEIEINAEGAYAIRGPNDEAMRRLITSDRSTLYRALTAAGKGFQDVNTIIRADRRTPHEAVIRAMDVARRLGHTNITFATQSISEDGGEP